MSRLGFQIWMSFMRIGYNVYLISFPDFWQCDCNTETYFHFMTNWKYVFEMEYDIAKKGGQGIIIQCHHFLCDKSFTRQTSVLLPEQLTTSRRSLKQICDFWILLQPDQAAKHFPKNRFCHWMIDQTTNITRLRQQHSLANYWKKKTRLHEGRKHFLCLKRKMYSDTEKIYHNLAQWLARTSTNFLRPSTSDKRPISTILLKMK